jgi:hypothetical protein
VCVRACVRVCVCVCVCVCVRDREREDCLCGLVVKVPGYRYRGPGSIPGATRFFLRSRGLERGPQSLMMIIEKLFQGNIGSGLENRN